LFVVRIPSALEISFIPWPAGFKKEGMWFGWLAGTFAQEGALLFLLGFES